MAVSKLELLDSTNHQGRSQQPPNPNVQTGNRDELELSTVQSPSDNRTLFESLQENYRHLNIRIEAETQSVWCYQQHLERPCFSEGLLEEILNFQLTIKEHYAGNTPLQVPMDYLVWASSLPGIYNLGGDLSRFCQLVRDHDAERLHRYARLCVDVCHLNATSLELPILTVALVQGDALGGGFESVLSNDLIIAEEGTKFGLPEVVFNLFPGMGAYSFLSRRLDASRARRMIMSGRLYSAEELYDMGIVDLLAPKGDGETELRVFIERNKRKFGMLTAMADVGRRCQPVSHEELIDVAELWVETTLGLSEEDLRRMERLVAAQDRRLKRMTAT